MNCRFVRESLSPWLDGELEPREAGAVAQHLSSCGDCARHERELRGTREALAGLPRLAAPESLAARVLTRIEAENYRGAGLRLLYRSPWAARPLLLPSLVPAALALCLTVGTVLLLADGPADLPPVVATTVGEWNTAPLAATSPLMGVAAVGLPRREPGGDEVFDQMVEGSLFVETVVATDGSVSAVNVLDGNQELGTPLRAALWAERFEPMRYRGRPVAVSVYRLISRMEVRAPVT